MGLENINTYNVLKKIAVGTFGIIYLCEKKHNNKKIAIKEIKITSENNRLSDTKNEMTILKSMKHPNIIEFQDSFVKENYFYIVMEYANNGTLHNYLQQHMKDKLSRPMVLNIFCQILLGLHHIHKKKVIHRDLKPENIFITGGQDFVIKIGDFGISKMLGSISSEENLLIGTINYMSPELFNKEPATFKSDVWALGCILYELCKLQRAFYGFDCEVMENITQGNVSPIDTKFYGEDIQTLINTMMEISLKKRSTTTQLLAIPVIFRQIYVIMTNLGNIHQ